MTNTAGTDRLQKASKDLMQLKLKKGMTLENCVKAFYKIMRKHRIKQGTKTKGGGVLRNNFEWTVCKQAFYLVLTSFFEMEDMFGNITPKDLKC